MYKSTMPHRKISYFHKTEGNENSFKIDEIIH
jgi:hypothetical protein